MILLIVVLGSFKYFVINGFPAQIRLGIVILLIDIAARQDFENIGVFWSWSVNIHVVMKVQLIRNQEYM